MASPTSDGPAHVHGSAYVHGSLFIDGAWTPAAAGQVRDVVNPFDQSVITKVDEADPSDVDRAVAAARRAFDDGLWSGTPAAGRAAVVARVADLLQRDREAVAHAETLDTGKTIAEARIDVDDVTAVLRYYAGLAAVDPGRVVDVPNPGVISRVVYEPVGVCALIAPWNYPLLQMSWKVAPALVAGNTLVAKPSEVTPTTTIMFFGLLAEAGLPAGVANLVLGAGDPVGAAMVAHPGVDLVSFTGGLASGRRIMAAAADDVKKVCLELGGKNPHIVFADADLDAAIDNVVTGAFLHSGQVCSAGSRVIVADAVYDRVVAEVADRAARIRLGSGLDPTSESGPLVSAEHRAKVEAAVAAGVAEGARLVTGGARPTDPDLAAGFFFAPTVFADCTRDMTIVQTEVFGPVCTVERFGTEDEAVALGNDTRYGLAGGVWTGDPGRGERVARRLRHGTVWVNDFGPYVPAAEWGGFGRSGTGRELGPSGLAEYREAKHVWTNTSPAPQGWFRG